jgi:DNA-directed RNA polymerase specialized sigma24 family protein
VVSRHELLPSVLRSAREELTENELFIELRDCMKRLEANELRLIELVYYQKATVRELEAIYRLKRPVLDMRKSRATAKLRECMRFKGLMLDL